MTRRNAYEIRDSGHCLQLREIIASGSGGSGGYRGITPAELAARVAIERRHDAGTMLADSDAAMDGLSGEHLGRCHQCGEQIGVVDYCPQCGIQQQYASHRNAAKRKTIGGFFENRG